MFFWDYHNDKDISIIIQATYQDYVDTGSSSKCRQGDERDGGIFLLEHIRKRRRWQRFFDSDFSP